MHVFLVAITDRPPVVFADGTDDGEPQSVALHLFGRTVEAVEYLPPVQRRLVGRVRYGQLEKPRDFDPFGQAGLSPLATI